MLTRTQRRHGRPDLAHTLDKALLDARAKVWLGRHAMRGLKADARWRLGRLRRRR